MEFGNKYNKLKKEYHDNYTHANRLIELRHVAEEKRKNRNHKTYSVLFFAKDKDALLRISCFFKWSIALVINHKDSLQPFIDNKVIIVGVDDTENKAAIIEKINKSELLCLSDGVFNSPACFLYTEFYEDNTDIPFFYAKFKNNFEAYYHLIGIERWANEHLKLVYSDLQGIETEKVELIFFVLGGIGDVLIQLPLLYCIHKNAVNKNLKFVFYTYSHKIKSVIEYFLPEIEIYANFSILHTEFVSILDINRLFTENGMCHVFVANQNEINERLIKAPTVINSYFEILCNDYRLLTGDLDASEVFRLFSSREKIRPPLFINRIGYRKWICMQSLSSNGKDINGELAKQLSRETVKAVIMLCHKNGIGVINIAENEPNPEWYDYDLSDFSLTETFDLLTEIDLFVGIDSCFGHACALLRVPSLSCMTSSWILFQLLGPSYRPLCMNYSLIPENPERDRLMAASIFHAIERILSGELKLDRCYTPVTETKEMVHYEVYCEAD